MDGFHIINRVESKVHVDVVNVCRPLPTNLLIIPKIVTINL